MTANAETVVKSAAEEIVEELGVAKIKELQPAIATAEELPEIVPGLIVPESPALPEDDSTVAAEEYVTPESFVESVDSVVATPVETIATPE